MPDWIPQVLTAAKPYWTFLTQMIVFWFVGQNMKKRIFTKKRALLSQRWELLRDTLWAHPMLAGIVWGLMFPWMPSIDWITTRGGAVTQGLMSGVMATLGFLALEAVAKKQGWTAVVEVINEVEDGNSDPPPPNQPTVVMVSVQENKP